MEQTHTRSFKGLLDRKETAELLGVSARTLDRWHLLRTGPPRVVLGGRIVRYRLSSIQKWLGDQESLGEERNS